jgi:hypothetical protein
MKTIIHKEIREGSISFRHNNYYYEFIVWYPNTYYGKREEILSGGKYTLLENGGLSSDSHIIHYSCFENKENCLVVAYLEIDKDDNYDLVTVGDRLLDLTEKEKDNFFTVYKQARKYLEKD